jgi:hypothetical protein
MLSIDLDQTDEVAYLYNDGTSLRLASSHLASELSFSTAAVSSIQVTDTTLGTGQSFSLSYGLPLSLSGSLSVSQIETVVFGSDLTVSGPSGLSVTESQSIQVRAPLSTTGDPIVFNARSGITITHPVISDGGNQTLDADTDADGVGTLALDFPLKEFTDPNPNTGNGFGTSVLVLPSGNVAITSPNDDFGGTDAGAVYLFNGMTGSLISTLRGSSASDQVGTTGLTQLTNGNYVIRSSNWDSGTVTDVGAVTWGSGMLGVSGVVSSSNSLVGSSASDGVGSTGVTALTNGNYVVTSTNWDSGTVTNVGAVTWGNGTSGISGVVSSSNSLVGSSADDIVGSSGVTALTNGNYLVASVFWDSGTVPEVGAVTWGSGVLGVSGVVSSSNSLVGSSPHDLVGGAGVAALTNGNYVVGSNSWDSGAVQNVGAATWGNGISGISGVISSSNSLVGSSASDSVGSGLTVLTNGNYVVACISWDSGTITDVGTVTWGNGTIGISGVVSSNNSLVGSSASDNVGDFVIPLTNGNYVVASRFWDSETITDVGALTWGNGTSGISGVVSSSNSLVGSSASDTVGGTGVTELTNGNYVVRSSNWDSGTVQNVGAVTWGNGTSGISGVVSSSNSLVGSSASDTVGGGGISELTNGNYVVRSSNWDSGTVQNVGAVTWGNGTSGISGVVSSSNSLVGSSASDNVGGGVTALTNGNYVVRSSNWDSGTVTNVGAVTWGSGTSGITGVVSSSNSLVGSTANDAVGGTGVTFLTNGNYVVRSSNWDSGTVTNVGAVTWGNGTSGISGVVSSSNSIVGQTANTGTSWRIQTASNLDAFFATNPLDGSGRVVLGSSARGFSLPSTPAGSLQAANGSVSLSVAGTNLQGTISSNANVTIAPSQTARQIDLGSKTSGKLGLTDTELDWVAAATLRIGSPTSGDLTVSSPISRPTSTAMQLTSGGAILLDTGAQSANGAIDTAGGTLSLDSGTTIKPATQGVDANTSAFSFTAGDTLQLDINGSTLDAQYSQLSVVGPVTLTGVNLSLNVNFPAMTGTETFTIVNATEGLTGQFAGLIQGGAISVGSFAYTANYTANSVQLVPASAGIAPTITESPSNQTVVTGNTATFTAAATGDPTPTVQWQVSTNGGTSWSNVSGATNTTYSFTAASGDNGNQYRAVFTNSAGSATSSAATLTVNYAPSVTQNPSSSTVSSGATASFTAAATGNPTPTVQWQVSTNGGTSWNDISGATNTTYSFTAASGDNGNQYRAVFTNSVASTNSTSATLNVSSPSAPSITIQPSNTGVEAGQTASFSAAASGNPTPSVQWQSSVNGTDWTDVSGATSTTFSFSASAGDNGRYYRAVFTNTEGSANSNAAQLVVGVTPVFTSPTVMTLGEGLLSGLTVKATGTPAPALSILGTLPTGVTFNPATGLLSGTAAVGTAGSYPLTLQANNGVNGTVTQNFVLTVTADVTGFELSKGQTQRSYIRYIDLTLANSSLASTLASNLSRLKLTKSSLTGDGASNVAIPASVVSAVGNQLKLDFGAAGLGASRNSNSGDGYYTLGLDLNNDGVYETKFFFYRIFGDVNGDRIVNATDESLVTANANTTVPYNANNDPNGDGVVNGSDVIVVRRALGRQLGSGLLITD